MKGLLTHIQRYTIHDGPGIRTELFFKGCPLRCEWCSNPETQTSHPEVGYYENRCIGKEKCGLCENFQKNSFSKNMTDRNNYFTPIQDHTQGNQTCPSEAIMQWGEFYTLEQLMEVICKDIDYYHRSGGGITLSGGEPLIQPEFIFQLLQSCRKQNIHTCIQSTLYAPWQVIEQLLKYTCLWLVDVKHMDALIHASHTGVSNDLILENLKRLSYETTPFVIRIPVIPDFNDTLENITSTAEFLQKELHQKPILVQLLPFRPLGEEKYKSLGRHYPMKHMNFDKKEFYEKLKVFSHIFQNKKIHCVIGNCKMEHLF